MGVGLNAPEWNVYRCDFDRAARYDTDEIATYTRDLRSKAQQLRFRNGQRFLIGPGGFPDLRVNAFLGSPRMRNLAETTNRDYTHCLALWLNFCRHGVVGGRTRRAMMLRSLSSGGSPIPRTRQRWEHRPSPRTLRRARSFYNWASGRCPGVTDIFADLDFPRARREARVRWLDPAAVARWRDVGGSDRSPSQIVAGAKRAARQRICRWFARDWTAVD